MNHKTFQFPIQGMSCHKCVKHVTQALVNAPGVNSAEVTLDPPMAKVDIDESVANFDSLAEAVNEAGYVAHVP